LRGTGLVRNTGIQDISGAKYFYDTITLVSGLNVTGDFVPSGYTAGNLTPKTNNLYDLGDPTHEWRNLRVDGTGRIDSLFVDENASITGTLNVSGTTYLSGDFIPTNVSANYLPKTDDTYDLGSNTQEFRNIWIDGTGRIDNLHVDENAYITGNLAVTGTLNIGGIVTFNNQVSASKLSTTGNISGSSLTTTGTTLLGVTTVVSASSTGILSTTNSGIFNALFVTGTGIPTSATGSGQLGQILMGSGYLYACTGTNRWGRTHLTGWT